DLQPVVACRAVVLVLPDSAPLRERAARLNRTRPGGRIVYALAQHLVVADIADISHCKRNIRADLTLNGEVPLLLIAGSLIPEHRSGKRRRGATERREPERARLSRVRVGQTGERLAEIKVAPSSCRRGWRTAIELGVHYRVRRHPDGVVRAVVVGKV